MNIELTEAELKYLTEDADLPADALGWIRAAVRHNERVPILELSLDEADEIRDLLGERLQVVGFDEEYEPTAEGVLLEALIDKFFIDQCP